jgi:general secretion pathway protein I
VISRIAALPQTRAATPPPPCPPGHAGEEQEGGAGACRHWATRSTRGFTLIEVVVALALVAVSLAAIGAVATTSARGTRSLEQHLALVETTRIVAATLPKDDQAPLEGLSGEILGHRWRISVAPFVGSGINQIPDSPWIPQTVVVRVRSPSGAVYGFETVRLQSRPVQ